MLMQRLPGSGAEESGGGAVGEFVAAVTAAGALVSGAAAGELVEIAGVLVTGTGAAVVSLAAGGV